MLCATEFQRKLTAIGKVGLGAALSVGITPAIPATLLVCAAVSMVAVLFGLLLPPGTLALDHPLATSGAVSNVIGPTPLDGTSRGVTAAVALNARRPAINVNEGANRPNLEARPSDL